MRENIITLLLASFALSTAISLVYEVQWLHILAFGLGIAFGVFLIADWLK